MAKRGKPPSAGDDEEQQISAKDRARIEKASTQTIGYTLFMRWLANFRKDEIVRHPRHDKIVMLSPMMSGRFMFHCADSTLYIGAQEFESVWLGAMPFNKAYVSDRLYLAADAGACLTAKLPQIAIGFFVDDPAKKALMAGAQWAQMVHIDVYSGVATDVGQPFGAAIPLVATDPIADMSLQAKERIRQQDLGRFL